MTAGNIPRRHYALCVYDFLVYNFHRTCLDIIHLADPRHLVGSFQRLGNALGVGHLLNDDVQPLLRLVVNIGKVAVQVSAQQQGII